MKRLLLCLPLLLIGCASTTVSEGGHKVFTTQMNCAEMEYRSPAGSYLRVRGMNHSTPTRAGGSVLGTGLGGVSGIIGTYMTGAVVQ
jgi:hypothetical protein